MGSPSFTERPARKTRRRFSCCTDFPLHRGCSSLSSPQLSDRYHLVAPDDAGFGHSDWPDPRTFAYTFDHYAEIMSHFTETFGLSRRITAAPWVFAWPGPIRT